MSLFPRRISWTEPWDWEVRKERMRQLYKELPPMWRIGVYSLIVFAAFVAARILYPETQESLTRGRIIFTPIMIFAFYFVIWPALLALPYTFHVAEKFVLLQFGSSGSRIDVKDIISLSFETRDGRRCFVVKAKNKKGIPYERLALMAKKKVTEEDVRRFLYDVNLAHLYVASGSNQSENEDNLGEKCVKKCSENYGIKVTLNEEFSEH